MISDISNTPTGRSWNNFTFALVDKNQTRNQEERQRSAISTSSSSILGSILGRIQEGRSICAQSCIKGFPCAATSTLCTSASTSTGVSVPSVPVPIDINPSTCQTGLDCLGTYHNSCACVFAWALKFFVCTSLMLVTPLNEISARGVNIFANPLQFKPIHSHIYHGGYR